MPRQRGSNGPLRGFKGSLWEGGHREPAIAYWPGRIAPGRVCHDTAICFDLFPTFMELTGAPMPYRKLVGVSLLPVRTGNGTLCERTLFWGIGNQRAVRRGKWKLVIGAPGAGAEPCLFDLANDLGEKNDLASQRPEVVRDLIAALRTWEKDVGA